MTIRLDPCPELPFSHLAYSRDFFHITGNTQFYLSIDASCIEPMQPAKHMMPTQLGVNFPDNYLHYSVPGRR